MVDANENMGTGILARLLQQLGLQDMIRQRSGKPGPATYFRGKDQIDGIWGSTGLDCSGARFMPFWQGVGDHCLAIVDLSFSSLVGQSIFWVIKPSMRQLDTSKMAVTQKYLMQVEGQWRHQKLGTKTATLYSNIRFPASPDFCKMQNQIDKQRVEILQSAEKRCRKLKTGGIPFSLLVNLWIKRCRLWNMVIYSKEGANINRAWIKWHAKSAGVKKPLSTPLAEAKIAYNANFKELQRLKPQASQLRQ